MVVATSGGATRLVRRLVCMAAFGLRSAKEFVRQGVKKATPDRLGGKKGYSVDPVFIRIAAHEMR